MPGTPQDVFQQFFNDYATKLLGVFKLDDQAAFHYICSLLRVSGLQCEGWDTLAESRAIFEDFENLIELDYPVEKFQRPMETRYRLGLVMYAHLTEMDAPYDVMANLLRVKAGKRFLLNPFMDETFLEGIKEKSDKKKDKAYSRIRDLKPREKIEHIKKLAEKCGQTGIEDAFDDFFRPALRNAIFHSAYVLHNDEIRAPESGKHSAQVISFDELDLIIGRAFAFYASFFVLHSQALSSFTNLKGQAIPFDPDLKEILELLFDKHDQLCGFKIHWPNRTESIYHRDQSGCDCLNIVPEPSGMINFQVGQYFRDHDAFSRLVPKGGKASYTPFEGAVELPKWPVVDSE